MQQHLLKRPASSIWNSCPTFQRPLLPSSGNDVMGILCLLHKYIMCASSCTALDQWEMRTSPSWNHSLRVWSESPSAVTLNEWFQDGLLLILHWPRAVKEGAYIMYISDKQRSAITSFPDNGVRDGLWNIWLLFHIDAAGRPRRFFWTFLLFLCLWALLLRIREVQVSNFRLSWLRAFVVFPVPPAEYRSSTLKVRLRKLLSKSSLIHRSLIALRFDAV
jgi:hypothetical protein